MEEFNTQREETDDEPTKTQRGVAILRNIIAKLDPATMGENLSKSNRYL
jgi:hypothetical protein